MTFNEYKQEIEKKYGECTILQSNFDHDEKNCENTEDRVAYNNVSWIDYWRAMNGNTASTMYCSCCGKEILLETPPMLKS